MKKNVLALSISAALVGFGFAGGALAQVPQVPQASALKLTPSGIGHMLLVPYYSAQAGNATLINITNTDTVYGKAVKVRFRGASNSDDVFDFQVFLSPGDVWTANVSKGADGRATLFTTDNSCTKPGKAVINGNGFVTARLDQTTADAMANHTREGYVEIFNMADIDMTSDLGTAIKHVSSVPPCTDGAKDSAWTDLDTYGKYAGLTNPTTGLMGNWIIINVNDAGAWSGQATAIVAVSGTTAGYGNMVYWPQTGVPVSSTATVSSFTADPLFAGGYLGTATATSAAALTAAYYDLPDMSTPYVGLTPADQADALSLSFATTNVTNEFLTTAAIHATTDWTLSMPTRRYHVAFDYSKTGTTEGRVFSHAPTKDAFFASGNTQITSRQICVKNMTVSTWDQEENQPAPGGVVISPSQPTPGLVFCGEAGVMSVNNGGSATPSGTLKATVARSGLDNAYSAGWIAVSTPGANGAPFGLPVLGAAFIRATAATGTFGVTWDHRNSRLGLN